MTTIIAVVLLLIGFIFIVVRAVVRVHHAKVTTGKEGLIMEGGIVLYDFDKEGKGKIMIHGEIWDAQSKESLLKDDEIIVIDIQGMMLMVKKK